MNRDPMVPDGFVPDGDNELDPNGQFLDLSDLTQVPCVLYTDFYGTNYFEIKVDGKSHYLPVRTD